MKPQLPRQQGETFALQERIGAQMSEIAKMKGILGDAKDLLKRAEGLLREVYDLDIESAEELANDIRTLIIRMDAQ